MYINITIKGLFDAKAEEAIERLENLNAHVSYSHFDGTVNAYKTSEFAEIIAKILEVGIGHEEVYARVVNGKYAYDFKQSEDKDWIMKLP